MQVISGVLKNYEWGSADALRSWTDGPAPLAELWFGIHSSGVSPLVAGIVDGNESELFLDSALTSSEVPILVKLLSAAKPLSVQVHPSAEFAHRGFHQLNADGAFADANEKIELLYALTDFTAFAGWRDFNQVLAIFESLSNFTNVNFFGDDRLNSGFNREEAFAYLVRHAAEISNLPDVIAAIPSACASPNAGVSDHFIQTYTTVIREFPDDPGALLTLFMDVVQLAPGESIFIPAGVPHSYVAGTGIEVMTSSDNVLRLGLTPKPVFAELALEALDFSGGVSDTRRPFNVELISSSNSKSEASGKYRLILALDGTTTVQQHERGTSPADIRELAPGQAAVFTAADPAAEISTNGSFAIVTG